MLLIALSFAAYAEDEPKTTAQTLAGCNEEVLGTTEGMQSCFRALDTAQGELSSIQGKLTTAQTKQRSLQAKIGELKPLADRDNARLAEDISSNPGLETTGAETKKIQAQLKVMRDALNPDELRKIQERMETLNMPQDFNQLTLSQLDKLNADNEVQKALGCGVLIDDKECKAWKQAKRQIHESHRAISETVTSALDAVEADAAEKLARVKELETQAAALTPFADQDQDAKSAKSKEFFDKLQKLGMLGKLAFMEADQLGDKYKLQEAQIDLLKEKIKNSILGSVIQEEIDTQIGELKAALTGELGADIALLKEEITKLKAKVCGDPTSTMMCNYPGVDTAEIPKTETTGDAGGGTTTSGRVDAPADAQ